MEGKTGPRVDDFFNSHAFYDPHLPRGSAYFRGTESATMARENAGDVCQKQQLHMKQVRPANRSALFSELAFLLGVMSSLVINLSRVFLTSFVPLYYRAKTGRSLR